MYDLAPSTDTLARLVTQVRDDHLDGPTPCPQMTVSVLLAHVHSLAIAFTDAAAKIDGPTTRTPPDPDAMVLPADWRTAIPAALQRLGAAWTDPQAWAGMTAAGGLDLPGEIAGTVAGNEVLVHSWDLAVSTGRTFVPDPAAVESSFAFCSGTPDDPAARGGLFGPVVAVPEDAPLLDRTLGHAGRDPQWTAV